MSKNYFYWWHFNMAKIMKTAQNVMYTIKDRQIYAHLIQITHNSCQYLIWRIKSLCVTQIFNIRKYKPSKSTSVACMSATDVSCHGEKWIILASRVKYYARVMLMFSKESMIKLSMKHDTPRGAAFIVCEVCPYSSANHSDSAAFTLNMENLICS